MFCSIFVDGRILCNNSKFGNRKGPVNVAVNHGRQQCLTAGAVSC